MKVTEVTTNGLGEILDDFLSISQFYGAHISIGITCAEAQANTPDRKIELAKCITHFIQEVEPVVTQISRIYELLGVRYERSSFRPDTDMLQWGVNLDGVCTGFLPDWALEGRPDLQGFWDKVRELLDKDEILAQQIAAAGIPEDRRLLECIVDKALIEQVQNIKRDAYHYLLRLRSQLTAQTSVS